MRPYSILFKKMSPSAATIDTQDAWGIVCRDFPFKIYGEAKPLPSVNWHDSHGDDEYIPSTLFIDAYELKVDFAYKGTRDSANAAIRSFLNYITGNDGLNQGAELMVYDTYTRIGRQKVRYVSVAEEMTVRNDFDGDLFTFSVTFRINDPLTDIALP